MKKAEHWHTSLQQISRTNSQRIVCFPLRQEVTGVPCHLAPLAPNTSLPFLNCSPNWNLSGGAKPLNLHLFPFEIHCVWLHPEGFSVIQNPDNQFNYDTKLWELLLLRWSDKAFIVGMGKIFRRTAQGALPSRLWTINGSGALLPKRKLKKMCCVTSVFRKCKSLNFLKCTVLKLVPTQTFGG